MSAAGVFPLSRLRPFDRAAAVDALACVAIVLVGAVAFLPGLGAGFVSDDFDYIFWIRSTSFGDVLTQFAPYNDLLHGPPDNFYRPLSDLVFWVEYHLFGAQPTAYHVVSLALHLATGLVLYRLARRLGIGAVAALAGVGAFVLSIHAHEVVFWWAAGHFTIGGLAIAAAVLAYAAGRTWLSLALVVVALLTDEAGVVLLPVLGVYEALWGQTPLARRLLGLAPTAAAVVAYVVIRLAGGGFSGGPDACRAADCDLLGVVQYFDQLFIRPGRLIELLRAYTTPNRLFIAAAVVGLFAVAAALLRVWRWRDWRVIAFGAAWCGIAAAVFIYGVWPDVSDRFLYYPEMGLALTLAGVVQQAVQGWESASPRSRAMTGAVLAGYLAWLALAIPTIWHRAGQWDAAGRTVAAIFDQTVRLDPHPPEGAVLVFEDVPDTLLPDIPPGNTGPYLLRNGLTSGIRLRYDRPDVLAIPATATVPRGAGTIVCFDIAEQEVVRATCPR